MKDAGISGIRSGSLEEESVGGCGAKLDPRDFGPQGKIDRRTYYIRVCQEDNEQALTVLDTLSNP